MVAIHVCTRVVCLYVCLSVDLEVFCINFKVFDSTMFCDVCVLSVHTCLIRFIYSF